jgi:hypothetical protein
LVAKFFIVKVLNEKRLNGWACPLSRYGGATGEKIID